MPLTFNFCYLSVTVLPSFSPLPLAKLALSILIYPHCGFYLEGLYGSSKSLKKTEVFPSMVLFLYSILQLPKSLSHLALRMGKIGVACSSHLEGTNLENSGL